MYTVHCVCTDSSRFVDSVCTLYKTSAYIVRVHNTQRVYIFIGFRIQCVYTLQTNSVASNFFYPSHDDHSGERGRRELAEKIDFMNTAYSVSW